MADLTRFSHLVKQYLRKARFTQKDLALKVNLNYQELNRRLRGTGKTNLQERDVKSIIIVFAKEGGIETKLQAWELLDLLNLPDFTPSQWSAPPLVNLNGSLPQPVSPAPGSIQPTPAATATVIAPVTSPLPLPSTPSGSFGTGVGQIPGQVVYVRKSRPCPSPPPSPPQFGGRDRELLNLKQHINERKVIALTAVRGLGGIGKTTLARQLAHDLYYNPDEKIFGAVLWKEIKRKPTPLKQILDWAYFVEPTFLYKEQSLDQLARQVKDMLELMISESCAQTPLRPTGPALSSSSPDQAEAGFPRTLVVFDDVWDDGLETVRLLSQACPEGSTILITTRSGRVGSLLAAEEISLNKLAPAEGVKLLKKYLPQADADILTRLTKVLGGHPLALTIAAKRVLLEAEETRQHKEVLEHHIAEYEVGLPVGTPFSDLELEIGEDKEDNLTTALYYSYAELNDQEQTYFRKLGILPYNAPFDNGMLTALWKLSLEEVKKPCQRLRLLSLLDPDELLINTHGGNWYNQHPLVQSYAKALLNRQPQNPATAIRSDGQTP